jgi:predicted nucleic acid-binding protein
MRVVVDTNILVSFAIRPNENFEQMFDFLARQAIT